MKQINSQTSIKELDYGKQKDAREAVHVKREMAFTKTYIDTAALPNYIREVHCLETQTQHILLPIEKNDWFAGRIDRMFIGIDPERGDLAEAAYFCQYDLLKEQLNNPGLTRETRDDIIYLLDFWKKENTYNKCREAFSKKAANGLPSDDYYSGLEMAYPMFGLGGPCLDYQKLLHHGIKGLKEQIKKYKEQNEPLDDGFRDFYIAMDHALDIFTKTAKKYAAQAREKAAQASNNSTKQRFLTMAGSLDKIATDAPETYHQAIQLFWLYTLIALPKNYGRMDIYLGDFLARDLDNGVISEQLALEMTVGLWNLIIARGDNFNNRIIIGGKGRPNEKNADRFAFLALKAQEITMDALPQLSLRWYKGMDKKLMEKSFEVIGKGSTFPIIYNDDVNVPGVKKAFDISTKEAEQYVMYGCGEYIIDHQSIGSPDAALNVLKTLHVTLFNGTDPYTKKQKGMATGDFSSFKTFEDFYRAFIKQLDNQISILAEAQDTIYSVTGKYAAYPLLSILYDNCLETGKPLLAGGVKHRGGTLESFGNNSAADALTAIKSLVYDQKRVAPDQLLKCLENNFEGYEKERKMMLAVPKYGNDIPQADDMAVRLNTDICNLAIKQKKYTGLDSFLIVMINNGDSVMFGKSTIASADGRYAAEPLSNGNQPSAGNDQNGATALLNSMAKLPADLHAGATHNLKLSRQMLNHNKPILEALIDAYFNNGGTQVMITVTDKDELERALEQPEKYYHIFVRVGGYTERFVDLPKDVQQEVVRRTLY